MYPYRYTKFVVSVVVTSVAVLGCSRGPTRIRVPAIKPDAVAEAAISQYDRNGDGLLASDELSSCPALLYAIKQMDKDHDSRLSKDELAERFAMWVEGGVGASVFVCRVTIGGRPLEGAEVKLVPEAFFDDVILPAKGTTRRSGIALLAIDKSNLPSDAQNLRAVQQGFYRVEITHPSVSIPPKYNTETTLGLEVSFETGRTFVAFAL